MQLRNIKRYLLIIVTYILVLCLAAPSPSRADIDSNIPGGIPTYIDGANDAELNWAIIYEKMMAEVECVDLKVIGVCPDEEILWEYRLPVQMVENVRNVGETMLEMPYDNILNYYNYELFYIDVEAYVRENTGNNVSAISIAQNQQRRSGLHPSYNQGLSFGQSHVYSLPDDYPPLILELFPDSCKTWSEYDPFKTDIYPNQVLWRMPEFTALAQIGADQVTPFDCAAYSMATGETTPGLINVNGISGLGTALAASTCASAWGGKIYPLNGHSYHPNQFVGDALRSLKAIALGPYAKTLPGYEGEDTHTFDKSKDALKDAYNDSGCIQFGDKDSAYGSKFPRESLGSEAITHYIHWKTHYCCY